MNWFGKKVSKVNRLESESVTTPKTNGRRCSHLMASMLKEIFHLHLGFFYHKMLHILPTKVRNEQGKNTFHEWKRSKRPSMSHPRAKHTRFKPTLTSGKRLLWYFWRAMLEVKKKLVLRTVPTIVIAHTFCASPDTRISYHQWLLIQGYFCAV